MANRNVRIFILLILSLFMFTSCEDFRGRFPSGPIESPFGFEKGETGVRFINLCVKSNQLDFVVATKKLVSAARYKYAGQIFNVGSGNRSIQIKSTENPNQNFADFSLNIDPEKIYTIVAYNKISDFQYAVIQNDPKTIGAGRSLIRFFHGTKDIAGTIDVKITNDEGTKLLQGISFGNISDFIELKSGSNKIIITATGTNYIIMTNVTYLESGKVYTAFLTGAYNATGDEKINLNFLNESDARAQVLFNYAEGEASVRFLNGSVDSPNLDFVIDNAKVLVDQPFKLASALIKVKAGSRTIKILESGGISPIFTGSFNFELDKSYMVIAINNFLNLSGLVFETPSKSPGGDRAFLRVVHISPNAPSVYIKFSSSVDRPPNYVTLSYRGVSNFIEYPAGPLDVVIYQAGTTDTLKYGRMFLDGGRVYSAYIIGFITGTQSSPISFDLLIDSEPGSQMLFNWF
ncbi:MAG: DUF4397 domain-containing protein [Ignavibacteria bacterium]